VSPEIFTANPHHRHVLEMVRTLFMSLCLIGVLAYAAYRIRSRFAKKNRTLLIEDPASKR
jgi:cbb3-type cytochrome oxidase subunit 3